MWLGAFNSISWLSDNQIKLSFIANQQPPSHSFYCFMFIISIFDFAFAGIVLRRTHGLTVAWIWSQVLMRQPRDMVIQQPSIRHDTLFLCSSTGSFIRSVIHLQHLYSSSVPLWCLSSCLVWKLSLQSCKSTYVLYNGHPHCDAVLDLIVLRLNCFMLHWCYFSSYLLTYSLTYLLTLLCTTTIVKA